LIIYQNNLAIRKLIVKFNTLGRDEIHILHDFFQGGSFFGLDKKIDSGQEVSKWVETINKKLKQHNIIMEINLYHNKHT
jgi:hypothetical protein